MAGIPAKKALNQRHLTLYAWFHDRVTVLSQMSHGLYSECIPIFRFNQCRNVTLHGKSNASTAKLTIMIHRENVS